MIDLHVHSTFSDGTLTPEQIAELARETGLSAVALTDHDCTTGVARFLRACNGMPEGISGVEISADVSRGTMHILGYYVDPASAELESVLVEIRNGREIRNRKILERLQALGMALQWEDVASLAGEDVVGRPHFAQAMMARGYVDSKDAAFEKYLGKGKSAYVDRFRLTPSASIAAIRNAGGVAVLAHPFTLDLGGRALQSVVAELMEQGLAGVEVYYSEHGPDQQAQYLALVRELGLVATGGSDFHGGLNPGIRLGTGFGSLRVPDEVVGEIRNRLPVRSGTPVGR